MYLIAPKDCCDAFNPWHEDFMKNNTCKRYGCDEILPEVRRKGFDIYVDHRPDRSAINSIYPPGIHLARKDFFDLFYDLATEHLNLGKVILPDGKVLDDFISFVSKDRLPIRGSNKSMLFRKCYECGNYSYIAEPPYYFIKQSSPLPPLIQSWGQRGLVINDDIMARIERGKWKGINIYQLSELEEPCDGFDGLPEQLIKG